MKRAVVVALGAGLIGFSAASHTTFAQRAAGQQTPPATVPQMATSHSPAAADIGTPAAQTALVKQYCATCHSDRGKAGGLSLASFDASSITAHPARVG
jgi:mono/diheme cytochrome c family protein